MSIADQLQQWRSYLPVPRASGRVKPIRWILLEGNRLAVTGLLVAFVFTVILVTGELYTFEMQALLTETPAVQTLLDTFMSGIILLVSIVVSINSIVLSHDMTSLSNQESRIGGAMEFRREVGRLTETGESPSDPASFLAMMSEVLEKRANRVDEATQQGDEALVSDVRELIESINQAVEQLREPLEGVSGADFGVLWVGLELNYGTYLNRSRMIRGSYAETTSEEFNERLDELVEAFELFATGKEYFKTLYYTQEVSELSRTLLIVSLPAILVSATTVLLINAQLFPDIWLFGLPPLLSFVATAFAISLLPFLVLTSYMLRLSTVAMETGISGPFSLRQ